MKKLLVIIVIALMACESQSEKAEKARRLELARESIADAQFDTVVNYVEAPAPVADQRGGDDAALAEIRNEKKVKEAILTDVGILYVSVIDDGTRRDGYAQYITQVLSEFNTSVKKVKVVKYGSTNDPDKDNAYGVLLGEADVR